MKGWETSVNHKIYIEKKLLLKKTLTLPHQIPYLIGMDDTRWGRTGETCSEDPFPASEMVRAAVKGMQDRSRCIIIRRRPDTGQATGWEARARTTGPLSASDTD